jgi:mannan endo-1,4-beta-mannosidase
LAPKKLIMDGTYGINKTHLNLKEIDIYSDHFYPTNLTQLQNDIELVASADKTFMAGEYDWTGNVESATPLPTFFGAIESRLSVSKPAAIGSQFWSLFMHDVPNCHRFVNHSDGFSLQYNNPLNTAKNTTQISLVREHLFRMKGETVSSYLPAVACPGPLADYTYE